MIKISRLNLAVILLILSLLLSACESPQEVCRRACREVDLGFFSYASATFDGGHTEIVPSSCCCQKGGDGELVKLW